MSTSLSEESTDIDTLWQCSFGSPVKTLSMIIFSMEHVFVMHFFILVTKHDCVNSQIEMEACLIIAAKSWAEELGIEVKRDGECFLHSLHHYCTLVEST